MTIISTFIRKSTQTFYSMFLTLMILLYIMPKQGYHFLKLKVFFVSKVFKCLIELMDVILNSNSIN